MNTAATSQGDILALLIVVVMFLAVCFSTAHYTATLLAKANDNVRNKENYEFFNENAKHFRVSFWCCLALMTYLCFLKFAVYS